MARFECVAGVCCSELKFVTNFCDAAWKSRHQEISKLLGLGDIEAHVHSVPKPHPLAGPH